MHAMMIFTLNVASNYHTYFKLFYLISDELWNLQLQLIDTNDFEGRIETESFNIMISWCRQTLNHVLIVQSTMYAEMY